MGIEVEIGQLRQQSRLLASTSRDVVTSVEASTPSGTSVYGTASLAGAVALFARSLDAEASGGCSKAERREDGLWTSADEFERTEGEAHDTFSRIWRRAGW
jgi:hypothetical protein